MKERLDWEKHKERIERVADGAIECIILASTFATLIIMTLQ